MAKCGRTSGCSRLARTFPKSDRGSQRGSGALATSSRGQQLIRDPFGGGGHGSSSACASRRYRSEALKASCRRRIPSWASSAGLEGRSFDRKRPGFHCRSTRLAPLRVVAASNHKLLHRLPERTSLSLPLVTDALGRYDDRVNYREFKIDRLQKGKAFLFSSQIFSSPGRPKPSGLSRTALH